MVLTIPVHVLSIYVVGAIGVACGMLCAWRITRDAPTSARVCAAAIVGIAGFYMIAFILRLMTAPIHISIAGSPTFTL